MSTERVRSVIFNRSVCLRVFETNGLQIYTTPINCATEHDQLLVRTSLKTLSSARYFGCFFTGAENVSAEIETS